MTKWKDNNEEDFFKNSDINVEDIYDREPWEENNGQQGAVYDFQADIQSEYQFGLVDQLPALERCAKNGDLSVNKNILIKYRIK